MKVKVKATHYVEAPTWIEAEKQVEQRLSHPDEIESKPAGSDPRDLIAFAISNKIYYQHNKIYFDMMDEEDYSEAVDKLHGDVMNWVENIVDEIIKTNEEEWS